MCDLGESIYLTTILEILKQCADTILKNINNPELIDYAKVLVIGPTESGKTALIHLLAGDELISSKKKFGDYDLNCLKTTLIEYAIRGNYIETLPKVYIDHKNKNIFIEFPDFLDNLNNIQKIINAFIIHSVFKSVGKMKLLLALPDSAIFACRGAIAKEFLLAIESAIPDKEKLFSGIALVITKSEKDYKPESFLNFLQGEGSEQKILLIDHFLNEGKNDIFMFPKPNKEGIYDEFLDYDKSIKILTNNHIINPSRISILIDDDCKHMLITIVKLIEEKTRISIEKFKEEIQKIYEKKRDLEEIQKVKYKMQLLLSAAKNGIDQFNKQAASNFPNESKEITKAIDTFEQWKSFFYSIFDDYFMNDYLSIDLSSLITFLSGQI